MDGEQRLVNTPRIVIAGTASGDGKTTVTAALGRAFCQRGLRVAVFKCGPDYLDPTLHARAAGRHSLTLDSWMMGKDGVLSTFQSASEDADIAIIEGVMGLYDGVDPTANIGSTAEIAQWLNAPVLLVVDASGMARSLAAIVAGFAHFDPATRVAACLANRVGSRGHFELLQTACRATPLLGALPKDPAHSFPERHLGLVTADQAGLTDSVFDRWAEHAAQWCDLDAILALARSAGELQGMASTRLAHTASCRIGIAKDEAFHFYYDENLRLLQEAGAELVEFSPVHSAALPEVDGLYLGGGYPELYASSLAANGQMREQMHAFCASGKPVYAECGGFMYLCRELRDVDGVAHPMANWFPAMTVMHTRLQALGYVEVVTQQDTNLGHAGTSFRGHQFRYSSIHWQEDPGMAYSSQTRRNSQQSQEGFLRGNVLGSYIHAHWASNPGIAAAFVKQCQLTGLKPLSSFHCSSELKTIGQ